MDEPITRLGLYGKDGATYWAWQCHDFALLRSHLMGSSCPLRDTRGPSPDSLSHIGHSEKALAPVAAKKVGVARALALSACSLAVSTVAQLCAHDGQARHGYAATQSYIHNYATRLSPERLSHNALRTEDISSGECVYKPSSSHGARWPVHRSP